MNQHRRRNCPPLPALVAVCLTLRCLGLFLAMMIGLAGLGAPPAAAEIDCSSIRLRIDAPGYDTSCDEGGGHAVHSEFMEASATDGSHFLISVDMRTVSQYFFLGKNNLREDINDIVSGLNIQDWRSGSSQQGLRIAEFTSDFKSIPSDCVAFQRYSGRTANGWRRYIFGFGCGRTGKRQQVYDALRHVNFPD